MLSANEIDALERARAILGEHFDGFAVVALDERGEFVYDYSNAFMGKALMREALDDIKRDELEQDAYSVDYLDDEE